MVHSYFSLPVVLFLTLALLNFGTAVSAVALGPDGGAVRRATSETSTYVQRFCDIYAEACTDLCGQQHAYSRCSRSKQIVNFKCTCNNADRSVDVLKVIRGSSATTVTATPPASTVTKTVYSALVATSSDTKSKKKRAAAPTPRAESVVSGFCADYSSGCDARCAAIGSTSEYETCNKMSSGIYSISCTCSNGKQQALHAYGINKLGDPSVSQTTRTHTTTLPTSTTTVYTYGPSTVTLQPTGQLTVGGTGDNLLKYVRTWTEDQTLDVDTHGTYASCDDYYYYEDRYCENSSLESYAFVETSDKAPSGKSFYTLNSPSNPIRVIGTDLTTLYKAGDPGCTLGTLFEEDPTWINTKTTLPAVVWDIIGADADGFASLDPYVKGTDGVYIKLQASLNDTSIAVHPAAQSCGQKSLTFVYGPGPL